MPVYLLTHHAYASWMPDRPQGYVRRNKGILPSDNQMAGRYRRQAKHAEVVFDDDDGWLLIETADGLCRDNEWLLYEMVVVSSHTHILLGWKSEEEVRSVSNQLKRRCGSALSKQANRPGPWYSRGFSRKQVKHDSHFQHLLQNYLPSHGDIRYTIWKSKRK